MARAPLTGTNWIPGEGYWNKTRMITAEPQRAQSKNKRDWFARLARKTPCSVLSVALW